MAALSGDRRCGRTTTLKHAVAVVVWILAGCASQDPSPSYQTEAMQASESGDQKTAIELAKKEVARFATPDQCSNTTRINCGTLALAYGALASYQILDGDRAAGELSFGGAKAALNKTDREDRASAIAMVYRDVSEAFWKVGDRPRAIAVFKEGRDAGGDKWLYLSSAARAAEEPYTPAAAE
jgi:hypothetical protein